MSESALKRLHSEPDDSLDSFNQLVASGLFNQSDFRTRKCVSPRAVTTFGLGAEVPIICEPLNVDALLCFLKIAKERHILWDVLGAGSNIVLPDRSLQKVVLKLGRGFSGVHTLGDTQLELERLPSLQSSKPFDFKLEVSQGEEYRFLVFGSSPLMSLSQKASACGLSGLEFAAGIPASLGGAVRMNAGAHGHEMCEVVTDVVFADAEHDDLYAAIDMMTDKLDRQLIKRKEKKADHRLKASAR